MKLFIFLVVLVASHESTAKISEKLMDAMKTRQYSDIMVTLSSPYHSLLKNSLAWTSGLPSMTTKNAIVSTLRRNAQLSQQGLLSFLNDQDGVSFQSFWISNQVAVRNVTLQMVETIAKGPQVEDISDQINVIIDPIVVNPNAPPPQGAGEAEWGVEKIRAPAVWNDTTKGERVIVANIDSGVLYTHEALRSNWREEYGWYDPYDMSQYPNDKNGHGTHTMGTIAGSKGVGVSPGSTWIACRGCSSSSCKEEELVKCGEWVACPTLYDGSAPDCSKAPALVSNSWGGPPNDDFYNRVITVWRSLGIIPVFAMGNQGPGCNSVSSPGDQDGVISVGATNSRDKVARFSSRGPGFKGQDLPTLSAPGEKVKSTYNKGDTSYAVLSGTSMACPHVAGAVALMLSKNPKMSFDEVHKTLQDTAFQPQLHPIADKGCGDDSVTPWPNNGYGYGRIDIANASDKVRP